jgi:hypothetical protein
MPEIWFPYGSVEVVLNVKAENVGQEVYLKDEGMSMEAIKGRLEKVDFSPGRGLVMVDENPISLEILDLLLGIWRVEPADVRVMAPPSFLSRLERRGFSLPSSPLKKAVVDGSSVDIPVEDEILVIGEAGFDVLYGYKGPWSVLTDSLGLRREVWKRKEEKVTPGKEDHGTWFAERVMEEVSPTVISYLPATKGVSEIFVGKNVKKEVLKRLEKRRMRVEPLRLVVISAGGEPFDDTLSGILRASCNHLSALKEGEMILVGEAGRGLGSEALELKAEGREGSLSDYVHGLEDLECLKLLKELGQVNLVTSLPEAFINRLGIKVYRSLSKAFYDIQSRHGRRLKSILISHGSLTLSTR